MPLTINYFQEVFMRLIDYIQIQILLLLSDSEMLTVNEDILQQLLVNDHKVVEKPKAFLENTFEAVLKKYLNPYFLDLHIVLDKPIIVLSPTKSFSQYFLVNFDELLLTNRQYKSDGRFN